MEKMRAEKWSAEDVADELAEEPELLKYFRLLPKALWSRHFEKLEQMGDDRSFANEEMTAKERRINYILGILHAREDAIEENAANVPYFQEKFKTKESAHAFGDQLRTVLLTTGNFLGAGQTARVKSMELPDFEKKIAVKYLLTPTAKTLSANAEYDMLNEVRTVVAIDEARQAQGIGDSILAPQPLFFYKRGELQTFGMEEIEGMTLEELLESKEYKKGRDEILDLVRSKFASPEAKATLLSEVDAFMRAVHEVCLHGDIKLANLMMNREGNLYLIDFGQSVPVRTMEEKTREQFENIMDNEREQMRMCLQRLFRETHEHTQEKMAA
jgi:serine/threonine protein kinase